MQAGTAGGTIMASPAKHLLVLNTCPDSDTARNIAGKLVADKLAACVQVLPGVRSYFRWAGRVDASEEHLLFIKTTPERYAALERRIKQLHPYELPEIVGVPVSEGLPGYLSWIVDCTDDPG